jgi:tRNA(Ile)-lysidine synthase
MWNCKRRKHKKMDIELCRELFSSGRYRKLFCGFSGGADSTAALLVADMFRKEYGFELIAVHFDHHLRAESAREAQEAEAFAGTRNIPFVKIDLDLEDTSGGIENAARSARLAEWKKLTAGVPDSAVILGHHADDKIENLLIRLFRGSNASGLSGLRGINTVDGVVFLRPLLNFRRSEIEDFLKKNNVKSWTTDSSNNESVYFRNFLRNELIPQVTSRLPFAG